MGFRERDSLMAISKLSNSTSNPSTMYSLMNGLSSRPSVSLEIRLFFIRIAPCIIDGVPDHLSLCHIRHEKGVSLEVNGSRFSPSQKASLTLRRDRLDKESSEVTYVSTDNVRVSGSVEFEVSENNDMILCGSLERMESTWGNGSVGSEIDSSSGWSMECYMAASITAGSSSFFQPKRGISSPSIEVYIAGCCSGTPVILTKTILISPRKKPSRHSTLDVIPENEEIGKVHRQNNGLILQPNVQMSVPEVEGHEFGMLEYTEDIDMYLGEDSQLSRFNAGVRVGVGIGLGMCIGIGLGVGLLLRSYQTTARNFRRRFL